MKVIAYIIDKYFAIPIIIDTVVVSIIWLLSMSHPILIFNSLERINQINILPNIISTDVSLAGFILAALTIIITFRSNLQAKGMEKATNALELILSSPHYLSIITVFKKSLIEFCICFICLFLFLASVDSFSTITIYRTNITGIIITGLAILRSLYILFTIMGLSEEKKS